MALKHMVMVNYGFHVTCTYTSLSQQSDDLVRNVDTASLRHATSEHEVFMILYNVGQIIAIFGIFGVQAHPRR